VEQNRPTIPPTHRDEQHAAPPELLLLRISDAARVLGIGRTTFYKLIDDGDIDVVRIGRAVRVPVTELHAFVDRRHGEAVR